MMTIHLTFLRARFDELKLLAEQASPAERARLEGAALIFARALEATPTGRGGAGGTG